MTSDLEATTDDLYNAIRDLWLEAQGGDDVSDGGFGQRVTSIRDTDIAAAVQLDLAAVREYLDNADGVQIVVERDGETRLVKGFA
ncbi:MAG TPA: hypothetical protein VGE38_10130 [Nocardioides sp.]|uniref:hypothetical protein n=1 Tax=Nocardioides sp. TaxID=35761 RepID=UPI002ED8DA33